MDNSVVLFDSDAFIGLFVPQDYHHDFMEQYIEEMDKAGTIPSTTSVVVIETSTYLSKKYHHSYATRFLDYLSAVEFEIYDLTQKDRLRAQALFAELNTAHNSLVDCCNVAAAQTLGIHTMAAFDKFYRNYGLEYLKNQTPHSQSL